MHGSVCIGLILSIGAGRLYAVPASYQVYAMTPAGTGPGWTDIDPGQSRLTCICSAHDPGLDLILPLYDCDLLGIFPSSAVVLPCPDQNSRPA